jgi:flagellar basal body-associated protein FliL
MTRRDKSFWPQEPNRLPGKRSGESAAVLILVVVLVVVGAAVVGAFVFGVAAMSHFGSNK